MKHDLKDEHYNHSSHALRPHLPRYSRLLASVLPLLVPFLAITGSEAPPVTELPEHVQRMAVAMLFHFPRLKPQLVRVLTATLCRCVAVRGQRLSEPAAELMLTALLQDASDLGSKLCVGLEVLQLTAEEGCGWGVSFRA